MNASPKFKRSITVLDAPSNLGLRPPEVGAVPGCYKLPWALRDRGLVRTILAADLGSVVPPHYNAQWTPGQGDRNAEAIAAFSVVLADRLDLAHARHVPMGQVLLNFPKMGGSKVKKHLKNALTDATF